jgi:hypothetical protein
LTNLLERPVIFLVNEVLYKSFVFLSQRFILGLVQLLDVPKGFVPGHTLDATL